MSSLRVRAQNKLLNKLGAAKPSKNIQFDVAHASFEKTQASVTALDAALRGFIISLKGFHVSAQVLYGAIEAIGGSTENSAEMKNTVAELKNSFVHVDVNVLNESVKRFENRVLRPTTGWVGRAGAIKQQVAAFEEEKLLYDHYTRKVMSLREARDKRAGSGKSEKPKDVEKLVRNEQKLASKTNAYTKLSEATITNLRDFVNTREDTLTPIIQRLVEFRTTYAELVAQQSSHMQKLMHHDSVHDGILSSLEKFVVHVTGQGHDAGSSSPPPAQDSSGPDQPVQALSFESFVGEAPPKVEDSTAHDENSWVPPPPSYLPMPLSTSTQPPPPPASMPPLPSPANPASSTASTPMGFFDDFAASPSSAPTSPFQTAPVQPLAFHQPTLSSPQSTPWDDLPSPPVKQPTDSSFQFHTMPTSASAPSAPGWDAFGSLSGADFQSLHQSALHPH